jgi:hypothetical protein
MSKRTRELLQLRRLSRIRLARADAAFVEVSRLRREQVRAAEVLDKVRRRRDEYESVVVSGNAWAESADEIHRAEVASIQAQIAADRAWMTYRQLRARNEMLQSQCSKRLRAQRTREQALEEEG